MSNFQGQIEIIEAQRDRQIRASVIELTEHDNLTLMLRSAAKGGVPVSELAMALGTTEDKIREQINGPLYVLSDLPELEGVC